MQLVMAVHTSWNRSCTVVEMKILVHLHVPSMRHRITDLFHFKGTCYLTSDAVLIAEFLFLEEF